MFKHSTIKLFPFKLQKKKTKKFYNKICKVRPENP